MSLHIVEKTLEAWVSETGAPVRRPLITAPRSGIILTFGPVDGTIIELTIKIGTTTIVDTEWQIRIEGVAQFATPDRPKILAGSDEVTITGLSFSITKLDTVLLDLIIGSRTPSPITLIYIVDDGLGFGYKATSTTSLAIGTGSKAFTTQADLAYSIGARIRATSRANTANWMEGIVTAYTGTGLTITSDLVGGSGTHTDWDINLAGEQGQTGSAGATGATGATGSAGPSGGVWRDGTGVPSNGLGVDGDYYLDDANGFVYAKASGTYSHVTTIIGPPGATGATGAPGSAGSAGAAGSVWRDGTGAPSNGLGVNGDYYLDDASGDVYLKAAGSYSIVANIKGATGATGATGPSGSVNLGLAIGLPSKMFM